MPDTTDGRSSHKQMVNPHQIELDSEWNPSFPGYWDHHGRSKEEYLDFVASGKADGASPPKVYRSGDHYVLSNDGSHRVAAAQELGRPITVEVIPGPSQEQQETEEQGMSM